VRDQFRLDDCVELAPRYNIAPMTRVPAVRQDEAGRRRAELYRWGLLPGWAKDQSIAAKLANARGETVAEKPAFRSAFHRSRCIVPSNGYYEWKAMATGGRTVKEPYYIRPADADQLFGLAERWVFPEGEEIHTCCIITTDANAVLAPIHNRMLVILPPAEYQAWLDPANAHPEQLRARPSPRASSATRSAGQSIPPAMTPPSLLHRRNGCVL
jgi:putative SOS response-associated peptidase YedK